MDGWVGGLAGPLREEKTERGRGAAGQVGRETERESEGLEGGQRDRQNNWVQK